MTARQRGLVSGTLKIVGIVLLACWIGGLLIALYAGIWNPLVLMLASVGWGFVGVAAFWMTFGGWISFAVLAAIFAALYVRSGRIAAQGHLSR